MEIERQNNLSQFTLYLTSESSPMVISAAPSDYRPFRMKNLLCRTYGHSDNRTFGIENRIESSHQFRGIVRVRVKLGVGLQFDPKNLLTPTVTLTLDNGS